jgi:hypothetical protein
MNRIKTCSIAVLFLFFTALASAQEPRDETKSPQQEPAKQQEARPAEGNREAAPPARQNEMKLPQQEQGEAKPSKEERKEEKRQQKEQDARPAHEQHGQMPENGRAGSGQHARPAGKSAHIPDAKFKASFGHQHRFKANSVINRTTVVAGQTQFVYGGYTFVILDPWPSDWLFTDDCYIDYVDGDYFLFDAFHPGVSIVLFVVG